MKGWQATAAATEELRSAASELLRSTALGQTPDAVAPDLAGWIAHLAWLESSLAAGIPGLLPTADEAEGLRILRETREKLREELVGCPHCGGANEKFSFVCGHCRKQLRKAGE